MPSFGVGSDWVVVVLKGYFGVDQSLSYTDIEVVLETKQVR